MDQPARDFRTRLLLGCAAGVRRLPNFRGKVRALLALHRALGLDRRHTLLTTALHHPVPFRTQLDLFCMHERMAYFMDRYEPGTAEFLFRLWRPGEHFVDIGANIGLISIPFAKLCAAAGPLPAGRWIHCLEAVAANRDRLAANIDLNELNHMLDVLGVAVGECEKDVEIQVAGNLKAGEGTGTANILSATTPYPCERIPLHVTTVDRLVADGKLPAACGLVKIDTDGYDFFILQGARQLLETARPLIYGEFAAHCLKWHGQTIRDVQAFLEPLGYRVYARAAGWNFRPLDRLESPFVMDALCVPAEKSERVRGLFT